MAFRLVYALPIAFVLLFLAYPLATILGVGLGEAGPGRGLAALADPYYLEVIWFSAWQAALSTLLTLAAGLPAAYALARYRFRGRALLRSLATVPFVLPVVVVAAGFSALLGPRGLLNAALQRLLGLPDPPLALLDTLGIVLLAHVFLNLAVVLRVVGGFWAAIDPQIEEAAAGLGASRRMMLLRIALPLAAPAIGAAALLVFLFCFSSFGVVLLLGGPRLATVEVEIYRQTAQVLRLDIAAALSLVQVGVTLLATMAAGVLQARTGVPLDLRARGVRAPAPRSAGARLLVGAIAVGLLLLTAPLPALALRSLADPGGGLTLAAYAGLAENPRGSLLFVAPLTALANSLLFALTATGLALAVGLPAALLLARRAGEGGSHDGAPAGNPWPRRLLALLFTLPLGVSAVTLGLGYIVAFGPAGWLRSPLLIPAAHALLALPLVVRAILPALQALDRRLREAALGLGASPARVLAAVELPLVAPSLLAGALLAFTVSLGDFGAALLLARPEYATVPVVIARLLGQPGMANYSQALALSTILMLTALLAFALIDRAE